MKRTLFFIAVIVSLLISSSVLGQSQDPPKFEVAGEFTTLEREDFISLKTDPGFGGRFTYNLNRIVSFETAGYYFPQRCFDCRNNGRVTEVVGGVKLTKRFENWGIFMKGRPGFVSFENGESNIVAAPGPPAFPFTFETKRLTTFAVDVGGGVEFYPSRRIVTRFDLGDTIIHFDRSTNNVLQFIPDTNTFVLLPLNVPSRTTHKFQFMTSVGFRF